jgi:two-component system alkaline phosphatase synthesis response regulator PhoP
VTEAGRTPKVLVVDDEPHIVRLVSFALEKDGFDVIDAGDGETAVELARRERPDLILMDVMMPVMDGLEASKRLKEDPETAAIPIVMLSAKSQRYEQEAGLEGGAERYIVKPFTPKELVGEVRAVLGA